jgi:hypothetical protein
MFTPSTRHTSFHSLDRLNGLANVASTAYPVLTTSCEQVELYKNEAVPSNNECYLSRTTTEASLPPISTLPLLQNTSPSVTRLNIACSQLGVDGIIQPSIIPSINAPRYNSSTSTNYHNNCNENNEILFTSDYQSVYTHQIPAEPATLRVQSNPTLVRFHLRFSGIGHEQGY